MASKVIASGVKAEKNVVKLIYAVKSKKNKNAVTFRTLMTTVSDFPNVVKKIERV